MTIRITTPDTLQYQSMTALLFQGGGSGGSDEEADESGCEGVQETSEVHLCGLINATTNDGPLSQTNDAHPKKEETGLHSLS